jgi:hypothetical protein
MKTVAVQIYDRYKSILEFCRHCNAKYGININYLSRRISLKDYTKTILEIFEKEGIEVPKESYEDERCDYLRAMAKQIKNWRAGL